MAKLYIVQNSAMQTNAAPVKQPTGATIRTMMQLAPATGWTIRIVEWGCSFDGSTAATPGQVELIDTGSVFASVMSTYAAADIMPYNDPNALANTAGSSGVPLNLGAALSAFSTGSVTEGSTTALRSLDAQLIAPTNQFVHQFPLGREPEVPGGRALRIRATFGTTINMYCYIIFEV